MRTLNEYINESRRFTEEYKDCIIRWDDKTKKDFDWLSGITTEDAIKFVKAFIDNNVTGFSPGVVELFYSGYAGWRLMDENEEPFALLMYDKTKYGLEDATQGRGWKLSLTRTNYTDIPYSDIMKMKKWVEKVSSKYNKPPKPRM